ncbi:hypothetical protein [Mycolicibacter kumamotonensis]|jgi:hypothetical protein|uniref:Uncharacterized protein n=1 Tax=Mycolicibacter kumamotonensis TaxID=354243 RepID=A0A7K3LI45_9MYCO|nr:hypothetical protein [Mycolicibacter kumamotonensis]NDJ91979.1 hypothetical protein [Mycolicibacter kumamotonensis]
MAALGALPAGLPTLHEVRSATFDHLGAFADWCESVAAKAQSGFAEIAQQVRSPGGSEWEGAGADAAIHQADADVMKLRGWGWAHSDAAAVARRGQETLEVGQRLVSGAVDDAERDGFMVGGDYRVVNTRPVYTQEQLTQRQAQAEAYSSFIKHRVANLVASDATLTAQLKEATADFGKLRFDESPRAPDRKRGGVQLVDNRTFKDAPAPRPPSEPDPVGKLGLPDYKPGSLSGEEARAVYAQGELRMRDLNEQLIKQGLNPEERAKIMFDQRNSLRSWVRDLMNNREGAAEITQKNPNYSWDEIVAQRKARGLSGKDLYDSIIESSTRSRTSVNEAMGVDPEHPPPLPPVRPPLTGGPGQAGTPVISSPPVLPPIGDHPPVAIPPPVADHPPAARPSPVLDHPPLPSWLQDPSPPGFQIPPPEPAPIFGSDSPGPPAMLPPAGPAVAIPSPPPVPPGDVAKGGVLAGAGAVGVWILSQLPKLVHPFSP